MRTLYRLLGKKGILLKEHSRRESSEPRTRSIIYTILLEGILQIFVSRQE